MTIARDLFDFVTTRSPKAFCDDCLQQALGLSQRQQAALRTETLGMTSDFTRKSGKCSNCHATKKVISRA